ncbi:MAG: C39 family peptidase [bacterium]|nr:C39 family peptidase [bacterium]
MNFKKGIILILFFAAIAASLIVWQSRLGEIKPSVIFAKLDILGNHLPVDSSLLPSSPSPPNQEGLPSEVLLSVPFGSQSPYAIWDERDEESCEEASIAMVHYFWQKKKLTRAAMRQELDKLIAFQVKYYGDYIDSDSAGIARIAREYYGYEKAEARYDITVEDLKKELAAGNPVIIPAAGRLLGNPNFTGAGPLYHVLVLIGYNSKGFIANDPGTRRGEKYFYSYGVLYNSIHDFPGSKEKILEGRKAMVVVY